MSCCLAFIRSRRRDFREARSDFLVVVVVVLGHKNTDIDFCGRAVVFGFDVGSDFMMCSFFSDEGGKIA